MNNLNLELIDYPIWKEDLSSNVVKSAIDISQRTLCLYKPNHSISIFDLLTKKHEKSISLIELFHSKALSIPKIYFTNNPIYLFLYYKNENIVYLINLHLVQITSYINLEASIKSIFIDHSKK